MILIASVPGLVAYSSTSLAIVAKYVSLRRITWSETTGEDMHSCNEAQLRRLNILIIEFGCAFHLL